jgi:phosphoribosylglycinamide formyltransferase 2
VKLEAEGFRVIPTARAAKLTMHREGIRRLAAEELGLATSPYVFADDFASFSAAARKLGFPCIVKPVMSSSGKGQSRLKSAADVAPAWEKALSAGRVREARVILEGEVMFDFEITQLTVRAADGTHFCEPIGHVQKDGDYIESWQPQPMSEAAKAKSRDMAAKVTGALGGLGIFGVELFIKGDEVWFSEVSPRPHDTGLVTLVSQLQSEFALHARAILGLPVSTAMAAPGASAVIYGGVDAKAMQFEGIAEALKVPGSDLRLFGKPESFVKRRMGVALARGDNTDEARARAKQAANAVKPKPL